MVYKLEYVVLVTGHQFFFLIFWTRLPHVKSLSILDLIQTVLYQTELPRI